jgi:TrmH family RNA methyltransferase
LNKLVRSLRQKKFRDQNALFIAEGEKLCSELLTGDFEPELLVVREYSPAEILQIAELYSQKGIPVYSAQKTHFDQMSTTTASEGIMAVVHMKERDIYPDEPFVALDGISNPGNVGTIIRTLEWFGLKQVILGRDCADKYNPKVVRASMGSIFRCTVQHEPLLPEFIETNFKGFEIFGATLDSETFLKKVKHKKKWGIIFGSESHGISPEVSQLIGKTFKIEGNGDADSLNVAMAVGISLYHFASV